MAIQRFTTSQLVVMGLLILAGVLILAALSTAQYSLWLAIAALAVIAVVPFVYEYTGGGPLDPFAPIFWIAPLFFLTYGAHAALRLLRNDFTFRGRFISDTPVFSVMLHVLVLASVGLLVLSAGYFWRRPRSFARRLPVFHDGWSSRRAWVAVVVLMLIGLAGFLSLRSEIGTGPRSHLAKGGSKFAFIAVNLLNTASIIAIADILVGWPDDRWRPPLRTVSKAIVAAGVVAANAFLLWQLGGRGRAFSIIIVALFLFHYLFRRFSFPVGMGFFAVLKLIPAWAIGLLTSLIALDFGEFATELAHPYLFLESPYTRFNDIVVVFAGVPERLPFQGGVTFLSALFALTPSQPFPETQIVFARLMNFTGRDAGAPITLLGELYLNFGVAGIIIGLFVMGVVIRAVYDWLVTGRHTAASLVLFSLLTNGFLLMGNFSNLFPKLGLKVLPMIVVLIWVSGGVTTSGSRSRLLSRTS